MYCLITTWHLIIVRWWELKSKQSALQLSLLHTWLLFSHTEFPVQTTPRQDMMVWTIADRKIPRSLGLSWANTCSDPGNQEGKFKLISRGEANSEEGLQDEVKTPYHGAQGPSPVPIFLDVSLLTLLASNSKTLCVSHQHHTPRHKESCVPENSCSICLTPYEGWTINPQPTYDDNPAWARNKPSLFKSRRCGECLSCQQT